MVISPAVFSLAWCSPRLREPSRETPVARMFRSPQLEQEARQVFPNSCHTPFSEEMKTAFESFLLRRFLLGGRVAIAPQDTLSLIRQPKTLLVTHWSASLFDGALSPETDGFLDDDAMPPWDTWMSLVPIEGSVGPYSLLSWVPPFISDDVDAAILVDAAECLSWLVIGPDGVSLIGWGKSWPDR